MGGSAFCLYIEPGRQVFIFETNQLLCGKGNYMCDMENGSVALYC